MRPGKPMLHFLSPKRLRSKTIRERLKGILLVAFGGYWSGKGVWLFVLSLLSMRLENLIWFQMREILKLNKDSVFFLIQRILRAQDIFKIVRFKVSSRHNVREFWLIDLWWHHHDGLIHSSQGNWCRGLHLFLSPLFSSGFQGKPGLLRLK